MDNKSPSENNETAARENAGKSAPAAPGQPSIRRIVRRPRPNQINWTSWLVLPAIFLLGLGSGWLIWGRDVTAAVPETQVTINDDVKRYDVSADDDPSQGPQDAPVTIIEFSDYQCPYCVRWYEEVYSRLMKDYDGKLRFVYRDFPLYSIHPEAEPAAEAANCAGEQGSYWPFHNALFEQKNGLGEKAYIQYAGEMGLNMEQFNKCLSERRYKDEVTADFEFASDLGVSSTPTFFVNGLAVVGAQPYEVFKQIIDKELAGEIPNN